MKINEIIRDKYAAAAIALCVISILYWSAFAANAYGVYHEYTDLGQFNFDMYYHIHYPSAFHGLQYIIFANHIAPDLIVLLPIYYLAQSPITLLIIQAILLSLTGLAAFFIVQDLLGNNKFALIISAAFLLNPGMHGMLVFDFHAEAFIPIFVMLTFYFLVLRRFKFFLLSLALLLGSMDAAPLIGMSLGAGLLLYGIFREPIESRRSWIAYSLVILISSIAIYALYGFVVHYLASQYAIGAYKNLPVLSRVIPAAGSQISAFASALNGQAQRGAYYGFAWYIIYALAIVFLGFGFAGILDPIFTIIFASPWLVEAFVVKNVNFIFIFNQYYGFVIGGVFVSAILALRSMHHRHEHTKLSFIKWARKYENYMVWSALIISLILLALSFHFIYSKNVYSMVQAFLFYTNHAQSRQIEQLNSMVNIIPKNASVMAPFFTMPHLSNRQYYESLPGGTYNSTIVSLSKGGDNIGGTYFMPQYILADFNYNISLNALSNNQVPDFINFTGAKIVNNTLEFNSSYTLYAYNGSAFVLKLNNNSK